MSSLICFVFDSYVSGKRISSYLNDFDRINAYIAGILEARDTFVCKDKQKQENLCAHIANIGDVECLKTAREVYNYAWDKRTTYEAAYRNNFECLLFAFENNCPIHFYVAEYAASGGHIEMLRYIIKNNICFKRPETFKAAARGGHLNCLSLLHKNYPEWYTSTAMIAARYGHLDCLKYTFENGCPWDSTVIGGAARGGHVHCMKYAYENGCEWDPSIVMDGFCGLSYDCMDFIYYLMGVTTVLGKTLSGKPGRTGRTDEDGLKIDASTNNSKSLPK